MPSYIRVPMRLTEERIEAVAIILFFSQPFVKWVLSFFLFQYAGYVTLLLPYFFVLMLFAAQGWRRTPYDFFVLWGIIILFFLLTYLVHPEYLFWYTRDNYGVWDNVLKPDNGIYVYFFLRLLDDPKRIIKYLKISAGLTYIYYGYTLYQALKVGYWEMIWDGTVMRFSYSLEFGYDLLLYVLIFLYCAFKYHKITSWMLAALGVIMIALGGSRGPILCVLIFVALNVIKLIWNSHHKIAIIIVVILALIALSVLYIPLLSFVANLMDGMGLKSRFIRLLMEGSISDDNGRMAIWQAAINMIKENPFGYGAMGSRHVISEVIFVGHPHNLILEIFIDYGVVLGGGFIIIAVISLIHLFRLKIEDEWKGLLLIFIGTLSQLFMSGTYWHRPAVWALLAIGMNIYYVRKRERLNNV